MNFHSAKILECFSQALACMARIEAMKAANEARKQIGVEHWQEFDSQAFFTEASIIDSCAASIHAYAELAQ